MMITNIYIIYNPKSTGPSKANAEELKDKLTAARPEFDISLIPTAHASHAEELAREYAGGTDTLIVSSSGDGGFHEVVNGVLGSDHPDTMVGLLPSGNANDHYHSRHSGDLVKRILIADYSVAPVLQLSWADQLLYAHSYTGLGLTAEIGHELNKTKLNLLREVAIVVHGLIRRSGVKLISDGATRHYDSLVFAVTGKMSKYIQTGADQVSDDEMTIIVTPHRSISWLIRHLLRRTQTNSDPIRATKASFSTIRKSLMQSDGEIINLPANTKVTVSVEKILHEII